MTRLQEKKPKPDIWKSFFSRRKIGLSRRRRPNVKSWKINTILLLLKEFQMSGFRPQTPHALIKINYFLGYNIYIIYITSNNLLLFIINKGFLRERFSNAKFQLEKKLTFERHFLQFEMSGMIQLLTRIRRNVFSNVKFQLEKYMTFGIFNVRFHTWKTVTFQQPLLSFQQITAPLPIWRRSP